MVPLLIILLLIVIGLDPWELAGVEFLAGTCKSFLLAFAVFKVLPSCDTVITHRFECMTRSEVWFC